MRTKLLIAISVLAINGSVFASSAISSYYLDHMPPRICEGIVERTGQTYVEFIEDNYKPAYRQTQYNGIGRSQKAAGCEPTVPIRSERY